MRRTVNKSCSICGRKFVKAEHLRRHLQSHAGHKPYRCSHCGKSYGRRDVLQRHLRDQHPFEINDAGHSTNKDVFDFSFTSMCESGSDSLVENYADEPVVLRDSALIQYGENVLESEPKMFDESLGSSWMDDPTLSVSGTDCWEERTMSGFYDVSSFDQPSSQLPQQEGRMPDRNSSEYPLPSYTIFAPTSPTLRQPSRCPTGTERSSADVMAAPSYLESCNLLRLSATLNRLFTLPDPWRSCLQAEGKASGSSSIWNLALNASRPNLFSEEIALSTDGCEYIGDDKCPHGLAVDDNCRSRLLHRVLLTGQHDRDDRTAVLPQTVQVPPSETLSVGLELYFKNFHSLMPFIHRPTFEASRTEPTLLLTMCLVGLTFIDNCDIKQCAENLLPAILKTCYDQLSSAASEARLSTKLLSHLASAMLLLCACHMTSSETLCDQAQVIYLEAMSLTKQKNILPSFDAETFLEIKTHEMSEEGRWQTCNRLESSKRLCTCLLMGDAMFSHEYQVQPTLCVELSNIKYIVPGPLTQFEAPNSKTWSCLRSKPSGRGVSPIKIQTLVLPRTVGNYEMHGILAVCWARVSKQHKKRPQHPSGIRQSKELDNDGATTLFAERRATAVMLCELYDQYKQEFATLNPNCLMSWHNTCMNLAACNLNLFKDAAGRRGPAPALEAMQTLAQHWVGTPAARRACVHAAQTYLLMSQHKVSDGVMFQSEVALFESALVLGLYLLLAPPQSSGVESTNAGMFTGSSYNHCIDPYSGGTMVSDDDCGYELLDGAVDWTTIGPTGLILDAPSPISEAACCFNGTAGLADCPVLQHGSKAEQFLRHGLDEIPGSNKLGLSFESSPCPPGFPSAQRVLLAFCTLLRQVAPWNGRRYCRILRRLACI